MVIANRRTSIENKLLTMEPGESLVKKYMRIFFVVAAYWIVSIATVFINKTLLSTIHLDAPMFITWFQCLTSVLICYCTKHMSRFYPNVIRFPDSDPFNIDTVRQVLPLSILFTSMIATNNLCLKYVSVAFYYIGRSLTTIFNVLFTFILLGEKTSMKCVGMCLVIILGFLMGVDQEQVGGTLSYTGVFFGIAGSLSLSLFSIYTKKVLPLVNYEVWLLSYYNNIYSSFLFLPLMVVNSEFVELFNYSNLAQAYFWSIMLVGGVCGFSIGFLTSLQIKVTSPLTHNISGTAKACAQTVLATYWYQEARSFLWWFSNAIVLLGSAGYARLKQLDIEKKHNIAKMETTEKC